MASIMGEASVPVIIALVGIMLLSRDGRVFSSFLDGAREGLATCVDILPTLVVLITAIRMFSASGALDCFCGMLSATAEFLGVPDSLMPLLVMRSVSGAAATATVSELFSQYGPDSFVGRCASVIMGSSDTVLYTLGIYFGAVGIKRTRHALPASFLTLIFCAVFSVFLVNVFF